MDTKSRILKVSEQMSLRSACQAWERQFIGALLILTFVLAVSNASISVASPGQQGAIDSLRVVRDRNLAAKWSKEINLASDYAVMGSVDDARYHFASALGCLGTMSQPDRDYAMATTLYLYGATLNSVKNWAVAIPKLQEALDIYSLWRSPPDTAVVACKIELSRALVGKGRYAAAESLASQAITAINAGLNLPLGMVAEALHLVASAKQGLGLHERARELLIQELEIRDGMTPQDTQKRVDCLVSLALCNWNVGKHSECMRLLSEAQAHADNGILSEQSTRQIYEASLWVAERGNDSGAVAMLKAKLAEGEPGSDAEAEARARLDPARQIAYDDYMEAKRELDALNDALAFEVRFMRDRQIHNEAMARLAGAMGVSSCFLQSGVNAFQQGVDVIRIPADFQRHQQERPELIARMRAAKARFESGVH